MKLIEVSPYFCCAIDPSKVVSVVAQPSNKMLIGKTPPEIIITADNGKEYHLTVTQEDFDVNKLYCDIVEKINEARKGDA